MENKTIKIPWKDFISAAMQTLNCKYNLIGEPKFMRKYSYESDSEVYDTPEYVEIELN